MFLNLSTNPKITLNNTVTFTTVQLNWTPDQYVRLFLDTDKY